MLGAPLVSSFNAIKEQLGPCSVEANRVQKLVELVGFLKFCYKETRCFIGLVDLMIIQPTEKKTFVLREERNTDLSALMIAHHLCKMNKIRLMACL